jgi:transposase InsO family protein
MKLHGNAALSLNRRRLLAARVIERGWSLTSAAAAAEVSVRTTRKWVGRYRVQGDAGLFDRSSAPHSVANRTSDHTVEAIACLRRLRMTGPEIAEVLEMACSTVSGILKRIGLGKLSRLDPLEPPNRYERTRPGELLHIDVKKLGRIGPKGPGHRVTGTRRKNPSRTDAAGVRRRQVGWEFVHVCVDDYTRLAYAQVMSDEKATSAIAFLRSAITFYASHGITVQAILTDNGAAYISVIHAVACRALGIKHLRTRPRRPRTNGKAERFIRTMLHEWAYAAIYANSRERTTALPGWLNRYNTTRPHGSLGKAPPISRLNGNNLLRSYS